MLDLDNTLLPWKDSIVPEQVIDWVNHAKENGMRLCIISNTHNPGRLTKIASELGISSVFNALKPRRYGFERAAEMIGCTSNTAVVVGDQLLTDILGGKIAGMYTILVKPMHPREFIGTKISRLIEKGIFALLRRSAETGTKLDRIQSETQDTR